MTRRDCIRCGQYEQAPNRSDGLCWECATSEGPADPFTEKILKGGGADDEHRSADQEVGGPPAGGTGGRPGPGEGAVAGADQGTGEGAGEGPGVEPRAGEVHGYRVFWVRGDALHSYAGIGAWKPGTNTAHCPNAGTPSTPKRKPAKRITWVNDGGKLKEIPVEDDELDEPTHGLIPSLNCRCGFWVYKSAERARAQFASELKRPRSPYGDFDGDDHELVMAEVAGWGGAVEGRDGWRFEKAKVVGLITDAPDRFRAVLDRYKIPALQSIGLAPWLQNFEARPLTEVLTALEDYVSKYVVLTADQRCAIVLWTAHTWAVDACDVSPYISVTSAVMRSGKTQLVGTLRYVVAEPWVAIQPTEAILFRRVDQLRPTLFLDEVDTLFHSKDDRHEPLRALLNAGNRRGTTVPRIVPGGRKGTFEMHDFEIFCPKLLAGIGRLPVTVADRSIPIRMEKKLPDDVAARFREKLVMVDAMESRQQLALWAASGVVDRMKEAWPALPEELNDRAQDSWEPLLAIADEADGGWPERARAAAVALARASEDGVDHKVELLADIREVFEALDRIDRITTEGLLRALVDKDPWGAWWGDQVEAGKLKSPAARLSRMLGEFGIKPKQLWIGGGKTRGYERVDFLEAWERNLPTIPPEDGRDGTNGRPQVKDGASDQQPTDLTVPTEFSEGGDALDPEAQYIRDWNADVYARAQEERAQKEQAHEGETLTDPPPDNSPLFPEGDGAPEWEEER
jgi:Protein of unknown function (DUF3631)